MPLVNGTGNSPSLGRPTPGVVQQDKSSGGFVDTTRTRSDPQRVRMSGGERPIGAGKGKQSSTMALCQTPLVSLCPCPLACSLPPAPTPAFMHVLLCAAPLEGTWLPSTNFLNSALDSFSHVAGANSYCYEYGVAVSPSVSWCKSYTDAECYAWCTNTPGCAAVRPGAPARTATARPANSAPQRAASFLAGGVGGKAKQQAGGRQPPHFFSQGGDQHQPQQNNELYTCTEFFSGGPMGPQRDARCGNASPPGAALSRE